jgi:hypothetical protein
MHSAIIRLACLAVVLAFLLPAALTTFFQAPPIAA